MAAQWDLTWRSRSIGAKVGFVVAAACVLTGVSVLGDLMWDPWPFANSDVWGAFILLVGIALICWAGVLYRRRYAGQRWAREVFIAMTALYAMSALLRAAFDMTWPHSLPPRSSTLITIVGRAVGCLLFGGFGVAAAWLLGRARRPIATAR